MVCKAFWIMPIYRRSISQIVLWNTAQQLGSHIKSWAGNKPNHRAPSRIYSRTREWVYRKCCHEPCQMHWVMFWSLVEDQIACCALLLLKTGKHLFARKFVHLCWIMRCPPVFKLTIMVAIPKRRITNLPHGFDQENIHNIEWHNIWWSGDGV